jgi:MFS family permease
VSRRRPVPLLLGAEFSAGVARAALATALGWQAYQRSHEPLVLGLLGLAEFLPALLLALPAGHIADRHDRRLVAAGASAAATAVALVLALDAASGDTEVWPLYLLAFCGGAAMAFEVPAFNPLLAASVPPAGLARVISLSSVSWQSATIVGPVTAGALQTVSDPAPYVAAAAACVVAGLLLLAVPRTVGTAHVPEEGYASATWGDVTAGIRFVRVTPALLGAISLDLVAVLFGGATALLPVFATDVLHVGADGNGLLRAASGLGAITVGIALSAWPLRRRVGLILFGAVFVFGAATVVFGLSTSFPLSLLALAVLAGADMVSVLIRGTLAPLLTPPELRGRVSALESVFIRASNELGAFESGVAAAVLGAVPAVVLGGIASMAVAVIWCFWFPSIRRVDRFEDLPDPAAARTAAAAAR